jgi:hypothetical protein
LAARGWEAMGPAGASPWTQRCVALRRVAAEPRIRGDRAPAHRPTGSSRRSSRSRAAPGIERGPSERAAAGEPGYARDPLIEPSHAIHIEMMSTMHAPRFDPELARRVAHDWEPLHREHVRGRGDILRRQYGDWLTSRVRRDWFRKIGREDLIGDSYSTYRDGSPREGSGPARSHRS